MKSARIVALSLGAALAFGVAFGAIVTAPASAQADDYRYRSTSGLNIGLATHSLGRFEETRPGEWTEFSIHGQPTYYFTETHRDEGSVYIYDRSRDTRLQIDVFRGWIRGAAGGDQYSDLYQLINAEPGRFRDRGRPSREVHNVEVRPLRSQSDAERECRSLAGHVGGEWNGGWRSAEASGTSICEIDFARNRGGYGELVEDRRREPVDRAIEAGPIWNEADAAIKCPALARREGGEWTGSWRTTVQGAMSVCVIRF